jgi:hypothetical protein
VHPAGLLQFPAIRIMAKKWYSYFVVTDDKGDTSSAPEPSPAVLRPSAADLVADGPPSPVPAEVAADVDLATVYQTAKIETPTHGYTVLKVADMLQSEHLQALPPDVKKRSILVALEAAGVSIDEIVRDAVRRDQALDTYERVLEQHHHELTARLAAENQAIEAEIAQRVAELRARIEENNKAAAADQAELQAWRRRKQQDERTIAEAVSYFVSENPISTAEPGDAPAKGDPDVR